MSTHIINFPGADIHTTTITSVSNVSVGENLDVTSNLTVSGNTAISQELSVSGNVEVGTANLFVDTTTGNVGVGTTEPTESLDIVGNLNLQKVSNTATIKLNSNVVTEYTRSKKLIKYPRVALNSASQDGYVVTASTDAYISTKFHMYDPFRPFVSGTGTDSANGWHTGPPDISVVNDWDQTFDTSGYNKDVTSYGVGGYSGTSIAGIESEWLKLELPHKIILSHFYYQHRNGQSTNYHQAPRDFRILGSNDDVNWDTIKMFTGETSLPEGKILTAEASKGYKYLAFVVTKTWTVSGTSHCTLKNLEYYGVPEYDPEAHGTDVIMRSVPNVPNTDWLEVYYDGQDYTSMPSTVTDKSGNGNDGTPTGVTFDSTSKAFVFDEADDYITFSPGKSGNYVFSASIWFKSTGSSIETLFTLNGDATSNQTAWLNVYGDLLRFDFSNNSYKCDVGRSIRDGQWHHVSCTYNGDGSVSGREIYLDGIRLSGFLDGTSAGGTLNLTSSTSAQIGAYNHPSLGYIHELKGSIANFRLFNRALSADEVWQLYAYQKEYFDVSPDVVTFKGGRLGIGTSEPKAVLDVRGDTFSQKYNGGRSTFLTWDYLGSRSTSFAQPTSTSGGTVASILDHEFNIPSCYHDLGTTTLKAYVNVDWRGELSNVVWNFLFRLKIYYNDYSSTYTLDSSIAPDNDSRGKGCGVPTVSYHNNNDSTLEAASVTSQFTLPNCQVSKGSKIKVELLGVLTDPGAGTVTLWTGRCANSATSISYEMAISSFFVALDVV